MSSFCRSSNSLGNWRLAILAALLWLLIFAVESACGAEQLQPEILSAAESIQAEDIIAHARQLCSPEFRGREAGTRGVKKSADYIVGKFLEMGLRPGGSAAGHEAGH